MYVDDESLAIQIDKASQQDSQLNPFIQDYSKFDPHKYLEEYYSTIGEENKFLLDFYHEFYSKVSSDSCLLEFGGGPTVYQLLSAGQNVKEIVFAEYLDCNRTEVSSWINQQESAVNWNDYLDYVLNLDNKILSTRNREELHRLIASKVSSVVRCDAYQADVLSGFERKEFDIVSSGFCLECISTTEADFINFVRKVSSLVRKEGLLVMTVLKNSEFYKINDLVFPTFPVDEDYLCSLLSSLNFCDLKVKTVNAEHDQGYEGIFAVTAKRSS